MLKLFAAMSHQRLCVLHNYFNGPKLLSDLYLAKFLDTSAKLFFRVRYAKITINIKKIAKEDFI